ncbi:MAG: 4-hydroxy-tetrahydrodipicolinate reductase [Myxococcota bacterium]
MSQRTRIAIVGAGGRMGLSLLEHASADPALEVVAAIERPGSSHLGEPLGPEGISITGNLEEHITACDVVLDFSSPEACVRAARIASTNGTRFLTGTTGLDEAQQQALDACAAHTGVLQAANFSVGVNVLARLVELASNATGEGFDLEVFEAHHRHKVDAPSGTALLLGRAAAAGRGRELEDVAQWARHGQAGARTDDEIGFQVVRGGDIVGEHTVFLCAAGERIELTHRATDRGIFARGALRAAKWMTGKPAGKYAMNDVLFR